MQVSGKVTFCGFSYNLNDAIGSLVCITCSSNCSDFFFLSLQILDEMPVFYNLNAIEKREVLIVILQIVRNLDDSSLVKAWQQNIARTRLFFKLLEECLILFEVLMHFVFIYI